MSRDKNIVIIEGLRTPFCRAGGDLKGMSAHDLGSVLLQALLPRSDCRPEEIDEVVFGNIGQPLDAINIARIIALKAGLPEHVTAQTVQRNCGSGMQALVSGYYQLLNGDARIVVAGGTESMSNYPLLFPAGFADWYGRWKRLRNLPGKLNHLRKLRSRHLAPIVSLQLALTDYICEMNMGQTAEHLSRKFNISREEQDEYARMSHQRAQRATESKLFAEEIVPVFVGPEFDKAVDRDTGIRHNQSMEALQQLQPVFDREYGTVTAGNASQITDGAAAVVMMSDVLARERGHKPLGRIRSFAFAANSPAEMGIAPAYATGRALQKAGMKLPDIDLVELNEAFAAVVIANERLFADRKFGGETFGDPHIFSAVDRDGLNVNGGAIALGHPVGASAARLVVTLLKEMHRRDAATGLATMCIGGGQGGAMILERV